MNHLNYDAMRRQDVAALKEAQKSLNSTQKKICRISLAFIVATLVGIALGLLVVLVSRLTVTLSDLSQQKARDISVAVFQECRKNFGKDTRGEENWLRMNARCGNVADVAKEKIHAAGVEVEDRVMDEAKKTARKAKQ